MKVKNQIVCLSFNIIHNNCFYFDKKEENKDGNGLKFLSLIFILQAKGEISSSLKNFFIISMKNFYQNMSLFQT